MMKKNNNNNIKSSPKIVDKGERLSLKEALAQPVGDSNFSVGQKQLLCLCRALLRRDARCVLLDEASSNIDLRSDEIIQKTIRTAFKNVTTVSIAHRLVSIAHVDKVIMMGNGRVIEVGSPKELMENKDSNFYSLVSASGKKGLRLFEKALHKYGSTM